MSNDKLKTLGVATAAGALMGTAAAPWAAAHGGVHFLNHGHEYSNNRKAILGSLRHAGKHQIGLTTVGAMIGAAAGGWHLYDEHKRELKKKEKEERMRYKMSKEAGYLGSATTGALLGGVNSMVKTLPLNLAVHGASHAYYHKKGVAKFNGKRMAKDVGDTAAFVGAVGAISGAYSGLHAQYQINQAKKKGGNQYGNVVRYNSGDINPSGDE